MIYSVSVRFRFLAPPSLCDCEYLICVCVPAAIAVNSSITVLFKSAGFFARSSRWKIEFGQSGNFDMLICNYNSGNFRFESLRQLYSSLRNKKSFLQTRREATLVDRLR